MNSSNVRTFGQLATGSLTLLIFLGVLIVVFLLKDSQLMAALVGYAAGNANQVVSYFFGSSVGSQTKDEIISQKGTPVP